MKRDRRSLRGRAPTPGPHWRGLRSHWEQSFPFSCGPAALGSVLTSLGWRAPSPRRDEELSIWRASTAIACPGAHPLGLAVAAVRRGFAATVWVSGPRPWLARHIESSHALLPASDYRKIEGSLQRACRREGVTIRWGRRGPVRPRSGLLLVTAHEGPSTPPDPHWIGLVAQGPNTFAVHDPLRPRRLLSPRTFDEWWNSSGFDGTRTWLQLEHRTASGSQRTALAPPEGTRHPPRPTRSPHGTAPSRSASASRSRHELARHPWTRAEAVALLESPQRRRSEDPAALWRHARLRAGETVVDVGAGTGYYAVPAARLVGPTGRVYALDLSRDLVGLMRERREREGLRQLLPRRSAIDRIPLPSGSADVVLLANVLHDIPSTTLAEAVRLLKPGGRFLNMDWIKGRTPGGPPLAIRLAPSEAERLLAGHGLRAVERWRLGPWHYGLTLTSGPSRAGRRRPRA
jgi:SAM-dependent methyltransferase